MNNERILKVLKLVTDTIGADFEDTEQCKNAIHIMLRQVYELRAELEGKNILHYYSKPLIEMLCFPNGKPYKMPIQ